MKKKKVLVIVAHPDDETIWMGGTLLKNKSNWQTEIISLCRKDDKDRAPKFNKICKGFNAKCAMSNLEDDKLNKLKLEEVTNKILSMIKNNKYDYLFTHGRNGEYGHIRHMDVHNAVIHLLKNKQLKTKKLFCFSYKKKGKFCNINSSADIVINLNQETYNMKQHLIKGVYGFDKSSFEVKSARTRESFSSLPSSC